MAWRSVGLQDDQGDKGIRRARITEDGALVVTVAGGIVGGGGSSDVASDETVTISHISTTDKMQVSLAEILTNDEMPVRITSANGSLSVKMDGTNPLPVEISNTGSMSVEVDNANPLPVEISNSTPLSVEMNNSVPLSVELADTPISVTMTGPDPLPVRIDNTTPIPVQIGSSSTAPVEIKNSSPVPVSLPGGPLAVTVSGSTSALTGPSASTGFGGAPGTVTAPAADAVITNHTPAVAGKLHLVEVTAWLSEGTPLAADNYNMTFKSGSTKVASIPVLAAVNMPITSRFYYTSAEGTPFGVHATAAGSPGVKYNAFLTVTRLV